jgi:peroxiredoxin
MKKLTLLFSFILLSLTSLAQSITDISLVDAVTGRTVLIASKAGPKGLVIIFHSMNCPFAGMYQQRVKALRENFQNQGMNFILINPESDNSPAVQAELRKFIDDSGINTSYLIDSKQELVKLFQISKIPEAIILAPGATGLEVKYKGAIDNNPQAESSVSERFLERAINQVLRGETTTPSQVRATGCNIRTF